MKHTELGKFILDYIASHSTTVHKFAQDVGVSHTTLNRWIDGKVQPSLTQLAKLAEATSTDLCDLVDLIIPNSRRVNTVSENLAKRIAKLPKDRQEIIDALLMGIALKGANKQSE